MTKQRDMNDRATSAPASNGFPATSSDYLLVLRPNRSWFRVDWKELWEHRDLMRVLIRRDLVARYRQTILGPLWFLLQPLIMAVIFSLVFAKAAQIPTQGVPPFLFYLASLLGWNFFSQCIAAISVTFTSNAELFGKVYFPRLILPAAVVVSNLFTMGMQFLMFMVFFAYFSWFTPYSGASIAWRWPLLPLLALQTALLAFGIGLLIASFTARYRDLLHAMQFLILGWMFLTPVFMPLSHFRGNLAALSYLNPMASIVEGFREILLGVGSVEMLMVGASILETAIVLFLGVVLFQRAARTAVDTV